MDARTTNIATLAGCAALAVGGYCGTDWAYTRFIERKPSATPAKATAREVDGGAAMTALRESFPEEFDKVQVKLSRGEKASVEDSPATAASFRYLRDFAGRHTADVKAAPTPLLLEYARSRLALVEALRDQDLELCADYVMRGLPAEAHLDEGAANALVRTVEVQIRAARAGADHPVRRRIADRHDSRVLTNLVINKGVEFMTVRTLARGGAKPVTAKEKCDLGVAAFRSIGEMPSESGARMAATFVGGHLRFSHIPSDPPRVSRLRARYPSR